MQDSVRAHRIPHEPPEETLTERVIDPAKILGLEEGDAHVIRNAGGRTIEALRSLVISQQLLGTREIVIIHHVSSPHSSDLYHRS